MRIISTFFICAILCVVVENNAFAQWSSSKDYVIKSSGDTIYGKIRYEPNDNRLAKRVKILDGENEWHTFRPNDISEFRSRQGLYETVSLPQKALSLQVRDRVFMKRLSSGQINLYRYDFYSTSYSTGYTSGAFGGSQPTTLAASKDDQGVFIRFRGAPVIPFNMRSEESRKQISFPEYPEVYTWLWQHEVGSAESLISKVNAAHINFPDRAREAKTLEGVNMAPYKFHLFIFRDKHFAKSKPFQLRIGKDKFRLDEKEYAYLQLDLDQEYKLLRINGQFVKSYVNILGRLGAVAIIRLAEGDFMEAMPVTAEDFKKVLPELKKIELGRKK